jgi:hypothetical protein
MKNEMYILMVSSREQGRWIQVMKSNLYGIHKPYNWLSYSYGKGVKKINSSLTVGNKTLKCLICDILYICLKDELRSKVP